MTEMWKNPDKWCHAWEVKHIHQVWKWLHTTQVLNHSSSSTTLHRFRLSAALSFCIFVCMHACVHRALALAQRLASGISTPFRLRGTFPVLWSLSERGYEGVLHFTLAKLLFSWVRQVASTPPVCRALSSSLWFGFKYKASQDNNVEKHHFVRFNYPVGDWHLSDTFALISDTKSSKKCHVAQSEWE